MAINRNYESEHTRWMREWLAQHPQEIQERQRGRALWWDRPAQSPDEQHRHAAAHVVQKSYYYDAN